MTGQWDCLWTQQRPNAETVVRQTILATNCARKHSHNTWTLGQPGDSGLFGKKAQTPKFKNI